MKIAVLNSNGVSNDLEFQKRYYYLVDNDYNFGSNNATDVTDMSIFKMFFNLNRMTFVDYRDSIKYYYENDLSSNWSSLSNKDKRLLSELFLVDKTKRDTIFTDEDQKDFANQLINLIDVNNKVDEASTIFNKDNIDSYINKGNNVSFGKDYYYAENDDEENANGGWVEHVSLSLSDLQSGQYRASWYCELGGTNTNKRIQCRVQLNNTKIIGSSIYEPEDNNDWVSFSGFKRIDVTDGNLVIDLDFGVNQSGTVARIRNARIELWRVS